MLRASFANLSSLFDNPLLISEALKQGPCPAQGPLSVTCGRRNVVCRLEGHTGNSTFSWFCYLSETDCGEQLVQPGAKCDSKMPEE